MIKVIYNASTVNNGEQDKDNNDINIAKYLEINRDRLLDLAEKNYKNLVEAQTNNIIDTAANSSNLTLSLPSSSSSIFSSPYNQSDNDRIEEPESFNNNKGDIDE